MREQSQGSDRVEGKVALVTGAGSGIGRATAVTLGEHGAAVACTDLKLAGAEETAAAITGGSSRAYLLDVTVEQAWRDVMEQILDAHGRIDIVVNCAGISFACAAADMSLDDWRRVMAVNLESVFLGTKHAIRAMRQGGGGSIVNVSSVSGIKAQPEAGAYCASKAAVIIFSKSAALECQRKGWPIRRPTTRRIEPRHGQNAGARPANAEGILPSEYWIFNTSITFGI